MLRAALRNLGAHKARLVLSVLAVLIGVAFVAGTLVFTDTLKKTFDDLFASTSSDVVVTPQQGVDNTQSTADVTLPASLVDTVAGVDGVARADGNVFVNGMAILGQDDEVVGSPGAPVFGTNWVEGPNSPYRLTDGTGPAGPGQVAIDSQSAEQGGLAVGDTAKLVGPRGPVQAEVVGIFKFGTAGNLAGASIAAFDTATAQDLLLGGKDAFTEIDATADDGVSQQTLADRVLAVVPANVDVKTGEEVADDNTEQIGEALGFLNVFLLVFAFIAVFVGTFIIVNTFSMLVAQRSRELALLRAVGALRRQVRVSVLTEALAVALIGSTLGLVVGVLLALGLQALFGLFGFSIPSTGLSIRPRTALVGYAVGVIVTLLAVWLPARRASRVPPVAAMRADAILPARSLRLRFIAGTVLTVLGAVALAFGLTVASGASAGSLVGLGALLVFMGVSTLSPAISRPVVGVLGAPLRAVYGTVGRLATRNAQRDRRRTASTASALMIGLALVSTMSVIGASTTASFDKIIDDVIGADYVVSSRLFAGFAPEAGDAVAAVPGVETVSRARQVPAKVDDADVFLAGFDPATYQQVFDLTIVDGTLANLDDGGIAVDSQTAENDDLSVGDPVAVTLSTGTSTQPLEGIYDGAGFFTGYSVANAWLDDQGVVAQDFGLYITADPNADPDQVRQGIDDALSAYPTLQVQDHSEYKQAFKDQINQLLVLIYALLGLAIIIAVLGIVNTLALSVIERTREIGLLRAVGSTRGQVRRMIRIESVVIAVYGALLGVLLGVGFGIALQQASADDGLSVLEVPALQLFVFVLLAAVVGVLAAIWPARRASKMDVLRAVTTE